MAPRAADAQAPTGATSAKAGTGAGAVTVLDVTGAIGPATSRYIEKGIAAAERRGSTLVVLKMDTPGGLDTSMRDIIRAILASKVPVATYVAPSGARAASAGTYIMYASHIAAMAPATNVGAATPVSIGGEPPPEKPAGGSGAPPNDDDSAQPEGPTEGKEGKGDQVERGEKSGKPGNATSSEPRTAPKSQSGAPSGQSADGKSGDESARDRKNARTPPEPANAMERKVINDAVAYIRGLAELRGRDADWAEEAVRSAASLSATAALQRNVIDVIARDIPDLLNQVDGREVKVVGNEVVKLATRGRALDHIAPDWRTKLLSVITNPTIAYGLLLIGIYGLLFEGYNPGAFLPGVVGAIALITALFAFQVLDVNYAGLALIGLGIAMIIGEFFVPSFGALGVGGLVAFVVGSIILLDTDTPGLNIGMPIIAAVATFGGLVIVAIAYMARRSMKRPVVTGVQAMVGATAEVLEDFVGRGTVRFGGELWNAISETPLRKGQLVRITRVEGLRVWVEPL
ncbi:MAG TPA: NfeD family protein [Steroidobacteraceae bacterium]|nr:NfeD family protein [Steroidobacteraceae bacterium]